MGYFTVNPRYSTGRIHGHTVSDDLGEKLTAVMIEYDCKTLAEAVEISSDIALERDEAKSAEILADKSKN